MADKRQKQDDGAERKARLAGQLRANLARRKAQARARRAGEADQRPDGLDPASAENGEDAPREGGQ
ncbi:hypothetical protein GN330_00150 [Nitratireductor sp. CAU 1489]|uniref:Uncharacterized protein n=1 Tax=Nitratireductor arenosus TaxID=2682096 RepID=A0A844QAJ1_9HYPH|nr:hypothetical protein [Nitratireductor arenosus]MVA95664.1 hypothetical protein [Nitratireductor arenosus]